jgi:hypothetical protein
MKSIEVPREIEKEKKNPAITILCDELCLAIFDKDTEGKSHHIYDIVNVVFPTLRHSYPEIKTKAQAYIYVFWSMKAVCWNNRAKLVEQDWFEAPGTASEALNDHLPEGSRWEARVPSKFGHKTPEQKKAWSHAVEMAQWAVNHLKGWFPTWDDQRIIDLLYNPDNTTKYAPRSVETALRLRLADI